MTDNDALNEKCTELRQLAEHASLAASGTSKWICSGILGDGSSRIYAASLGPLRKVVDVAVSEGAFARHIAAADPHTILALLAEHEALLAQLAALRELNAALVKQKRCTQCLAPLSSGDKPQPGAGAQLARDCARATEAKGQTMTKPVAPEVDLDPLIKLAHIGESSRVGCAAVPVHTLRALIAETRALRAAKAEFACYAISPTSRDFKRWEQAVAKLPSVDDWSGCPCTLVTPCRSSCTCAYRGLSGGCGRCASYGSAEQRLSAARRLASLQLLPEHTYEAGWDAGHRARDEELRAPVGVVTREQRRKVLWALATEWTRRHESGDTGAGGLVDAFAAAEALSEALRWIAAQEMDLVELTTKLEVQVSATTAIIETKQGQLAQAIADAEARGAAAKPPAGVEVAEALEKLEKLVNTNLHSDAHEEAHGLLATIRASSKGDKT